MCSPLPNAVKTKRRKKKVTPFGQRGFVNPVFFLHIGVDADDMPMPMQRFVYFSLGQSERVKASSPRLGVE